MIIIIAIQKRNIFVLDIENEFYMTFKEQIKQGIPDVLPKIKEYELDINHAPKRKEILSADEKKLALRNALRYFDAKHHEVLLPEFIIELEQYGRIYTVSYTHLTLPTI